MHLLSNQGKSFHIFLRQPGLNLIERLAILLLSPQRQNCLWQVVSIPLELDIQIASPFHDRVEVLALKHSLTSGLSLAKPFQEQHRRSRNLFLRLAFNRNGSSGLMGSHVKSLINGLRPAMMAASSPRNSRSSSSTGPVSGVG